jgi:hypothetical protein
MAAALCGLAMLGAHADDTVRTPQEHRRGAEQTFLTFPEWYLVFSPAAFATFTARHSPSDFPWFGETAQFWQSYRAVTDATRKDYPFNAGYHVMIGVIGTSTTVEYVLRAAYETTIGRAAELTRTHGMTNEERFAAKAAQDYVDFIRVSPWYDFDFVSRLKGLWTTTGWFGHDMIRKVERKLALSLEYAIKAVYGELIGLATHSAYERPLLVTAIVADRVPAADATLPELTVVERFADGTALLTVPRYEAFARYATALARQGVAFREIAGNRSTILVSVLAPQAWEPRDHGVQVLFTQTVLTEPARKRVALTVPVAQLAAVLPQFATAPLALEHVFDY